ncbi:SGNH hydrolase-type esterase domain-containing protein [Pseudomassariella vexata]|uniref:SGNH hydrolase-type esterase domain-containing protein n=1 Tax=Pseudomassariella vexata TaxID=1141098 RepID=A0A1Y2EHJ2_9PEZI|nr:SGNH hydrolase-type esterase domain-containing protein [Pseudomassariella vexata]ORY71041.1 SGNH hydrolase-type esterase domain-containing protein [Pseudomassariella vexata]
MMFVNNKSPVWSSWSTSLPALARRHMTALCVVIGFSFLFTVISLFDGSYNLSWRWTSSPASSSTNASEEITTPQPLVANGMPLRIMCLGASVVKGEVSNGTYGFRKPLRDTLVSMGNPVNMVGSAQVGDMMDNDVEAHGGNRVDQVYEWATHSVPDMKPNLMILNVGSNDCLQHYDTENYYKRLDYFVNWLLNTSPRGTVLLSTLLTNTVKNMEPCVLDINEQMRTLYTILKSEGKRVVLAEMHYKFVPEGDTLERPQVHHITPDGTHPNDEGYGLMADIFMQSIREIDELGFFQEPEDNGIMSDGDAEKVIQAKQKVEDDIRKMTAELRDTPGVTEMPKKTSTKTPAKSPTEQHKRRRRRS